MDSVGRSNKDKIHDGVYQRNRKIEHLKDKIHIDNRTGISEAQRRRKKPKGIQVVDRCSL